jgi:basic amino acid/polyamine antiporter, APA family
VPSPSHSAAARTTPADSTNRPPGQQLERRLGPLDAAAIIVSNVIGAGILFTPPEIARSVPSGLAFLGVWLAGGLLAFAGAMAYAELAALRPRAGGEYVYLRDAFGPLAAFLTGWTSFVAGFSGAIAASALVFPFYLSRFVPAVASGDALFTVPILPGTLELTFSPQTMCALALIWGLAFVHLRGVGPGRAVSNLLAGLKVSAFVLFIAFGFSIGSGEPERLTQTVAPVTAAGWALALLAVGFTYSGWNAAGYIAEEIRDPGRNAPRAFALGTAAVIAIYLLMNALYLYVVPIDELARLEGSVLDFVADRLIGPTAGNIMGIVGLISLAASVSAMTFAGPRVYFAMARDGAFFRNAAAIHPQYRTPAWSIVAQTLWASALLLSAKADALINYTGFAIWLFSGVAVAALFVLRRREPNADRPFRTWGYPVLPALYAIVAFAVLVNALYRDPGPVGTGAAIIAAGIPLFFWFRRKS